MLHVPDCPLVEQLRTRLHACLQRSGAAVEVEEFEGAYPSPTLLINGVDVATGNAPSEEVSCRLDLPSDEQIITALWAGN